VKMRSRAFVGLLGLLLISPALGQRRANPLLAMAVRLATLEPQVREASFLIVEDTERRHRPLPVPVSVESAFNRVTRLVPGRFTLHYVDDSSVNAFSVATGDIVVNRGLYEKSDGDEGILAMVIGHEAAHVVRKHSLNRMVKATIADAALYAILSNSRQNKAAFVLAFTAFLARSSRDDEWEAARFGFVYAIQAGYDPESCVAAEELIRREGAENTDFLLSHPGGRVRVEQMRKFAQAYRKGVPLEFIRYGKLDTDLEKGIGELPSLPLLTVPGLSVLVNAPPSAYTMAIHPRFRIETEEEGFLSVLVRAPDGTVGCLFPNQFEPDSACKPGKAIDIPSYDYRSRKKDLIRLRWDMRGDHQYLFVLTDRPVDWAQRVGTRIKQDDFKDALLDTAETQGCRILGHGYETLSVR